MDSSNMLPNELEGLILEMSDEGMDITKDPETLTFGWCKDGRLDVACHAPHGRRLSRLLEAVQHEDQQNRDSSPPPAYREIQGDEPYALRLNIAIQVVGSRGDVQPFIAIGCALQRDHGHRVRLATHAVFEDSVRSAGLEFYPLGGDPTELMAYMVKNPGLIPSIDSLKSGDIGRKRDMLQAIMSGCWKSCIERDPQSQSPFVADAIIANPPSFGHVHCAQALGIPLHIMFTMPWTTTRAFSHPLANLKVSAETSAGNANLISYGVVEWLTWQGVGDIVNKWRTETLELEPVPESEGPKLVERLAIPHTYCWSPGLVSKPSDWPSYIDVCGFIFREPPDYQPPKDLAGFLAGGEMPIYIGFGSIVVDNPKTLTAMIVQAVRKLKIRALVSRGWSNLGEGCESDENVFFLGDCPHEWLFTRVAAVVHHGGAGTTACGLLNGVPTSIVPFFGDQPFWGDMVASKGVGPPPVKHGALSLETLIHAISFCLLPETRLAAQAVASKMKQENGVRDAVKSFHTHLPRELGCQVVPDEVAAWKHKSKTRLSKRAASALLKSSLIKAEAISSLETKPIHIEPRRWEPVSAILSASMQTAGSMANAAKRMVADPYKAYKPSKAPEKSALNNSIPQDSDSTDLVREKEPADLGAQPQEKQEGSKAPSASLGHRVSGTQTQDLAALDGQEADVSLPKGAAKQFASTSARSAGRLVFSPIKGLLVDVPLAATEGMRALPRLYGDRGYQREAITDWKSGSVVAAKSFASGVTEGVTDIFRLTYTRKRREGAKGVAKGLSMGLVNFAMKTSSGALGLVAYPCRGVYLSVHAALHTKTKKTVEQAKLDEGEWLLAAKKENRPSESDIVRSFVEASASR